MEATTQKTDYENKTIGQLVSEDFARAGVFKKFGIDFCCGGNKSARKACEEKGIDFDALRLELEAAENKKDNAPSHNFNQWDLGFLADYIVNQHHKYIKENTPVIMEYAKKVAKVHGHANPEVIEISRLFTELSNELQMHMMKEEGILFPYIKQLAEAHKENREAPTPPFMTVQNPVRMMEAEHDIAGELMKKIQKLSNAYTPPDHACNTYRVEYFKLEEYENDLFQHIHLENNILFPKAIAMEKAMQKKEGV